MFVVRLRQIYFLFSLYKAGLDLSRLHIALESESAAVYHQYEKTETFLSSAPVGTKYIVADIGGMKKNLVIGSSY